MMWTAVETARCSTSSLRCTPSGAFDWAVRSFSRVVRTIVSLTSGRVRRSACSLAFGSSSTQTSVSATRVFPFVLRPAAGGSRSPATPETLHDPLPSLLVDVHHPDLPRDHEEHRLERGTGAQDDRLLRNVAHREVRRHGLLGIGAQVGEQLAPAKQAMRSLTSISGTGCWKTSCTLPKVMRPPE